MATARIDEFSPYGMACAECNALLVAPNSSRYVSKHEVLHSWACEDCGYQLEMVVDLRITASEARESAKPSSLVG
jgi:RNase P subunit RPR2